MILSSQIVSVSPQRDGRSYVTELHVDDQYGPMRFVYLDWVGADRAAILAARAAAINAEPRESFADLDQLDSLTATQKTQLRNALDIIDTIKPLLAKFLRAPAARQQQILDTYPAAARLIRTITWQ